MSRRTAATVTLLVVSGLTVGGCSGTTTTTGSGDASTPAASTASGGQTSAAGGGAVCDEAEVTKQVERVLTAGGAMTLTSVNEYRCAPGWAAAKLTAEPPPTEMILIFYDDGQGWLPAAMNVCGTSQADSEVPAELYEFACPTL